MGFSGKIWAQLETRLPSDLYHTATSQVNLCEERCRVFSFFNTKLFRIYKIILDAIKGKFIAFITIKGKKKRTKYVILLMVSNLYPLLHFLYEGIKGTSHVYSLSKKIVKYFTDGELSYTQANSGHISCWKLLSKWSKTELLYHVLLEWYLYTFLLLLLN